MNIHNLTDQRPSTPTSMLSDVVSLDQILSLSIARCSCFCTRFTQKTTSSASQSLRTLHVAARVPKWERNSLCKPTFFIELYARWMGKKSTSMSINRPVTSGIIEENCEQETFAGPSFVIAAMQVRANIRRDISLVFPERDCNPFPLLEAN